MIKVKDDWSWITSHAKNMMMEDKQLQEDVLRVAIKNKIDVIRIIELYAEAIDSGMIGGKYLDFENWFYAFFHEEF